MKTSKTENQFKTGLNYQQWVCQKTGINIPSSFFIHCCVFWFPVLFSTI